MSSGNCQGRHVHDICEEVWSRVSVGPSKIAHSCPNANQKSQTAGWALRFVPVWVFTEGLLHTHPVLVYAHFKEPTRGHNHGDGTWEDPSHPNKVGPSPAKKASESRRTSLSPPNLCSLTSPPSRPPPPAPHEHLPCPISPGPAPITTSAWQLFKPTDSYLTEAFVLYCLFYVKKCLLSWKSTLEKLCSY